MALLDGGATRSALPEEVVLAVIGCTLKQIEAGNYSADSQAYPIVRLQRLVKRPRIDGVAAGAPIEITYTVVLRVEFSGGCVLRADEGLVLQGVPEGHVPGARRHHWIPGLGRGPLRPWLGGSPDGPHVHGSQGISATAGVGTEEPVRGGEEVALRPLGYARFRA